MKAKTLMGMIACAGACVSLSAFGNNTNGWFGVTVDTTITPINCTTNGAAVSIANSKIVLDNAKDTALTITPAVNAPTNSNDGVFVIKATALLTPSSTNDFDVTTGAKAGFAVGVDDQNATNYYGYANGVWNKLTDATVVAEGSDTTFKLILNYRDSKVDFYAGADAATHLGQFNLASGTTAPLGIDAFGAGSITSITGEYEVAVAAYDNKKYGSIAEAVTAAKDAGDTGADVQAIGADGAPKATSETAANGMNLVVCEALGLDVNDATANITVAPLATDTAVDKITLRLTNENLGPESNLVGYKVSGGTAEDSVCEPNNIQIPLAAGTYTITPVLK
ncbi:MAG: hypothetical protein IKQ17_12155 [Kiritimatiellae bacterium]|nr:hypothetical protein [Kiritimatiellia bacterium]